MTTTLTTTENLLSSPQLPVNTFPRWRKRKEGKEKRGLVFFCLCLHFLIPYLLSSPAPHTLDWSQVSLAPCGVRSDWTLTSLGKPAPALPSLFRFSFFLFCYSRKSQFLLFFPLLCPLLLYSLLSLQLRPDRPSVRAGRRSDWPRARMKRGRDWLLPRDSAGVIRSFNTSRCLSSSSSSSSRGAGSLLRNVQTGNCTAQQIFPQSWSSVGVCPLTPRGQRSQVTDRGLLWEGRLLSEQLLLP